jgi:uncharacterized protein YbjT (DUF2867 family)
MVMKNEQKATLVLGGTGKTGRRVVKRLTDRGVPVRIASRTGAPPFDWADERTWRPVLENVDVMYVAYHPDLAAPGAPPTLRALAKLAVESGVRRIVLLSGRGEPEAEVSEQAVRESGIDLTVIRAAWFCQNFSEGEFASSVRRGEIMLPGNTTVAEPFIDVEDIADVAVATLTDDVHIGKTYELTGPRLLTLAEAAAEIAAAAGRPVRYVPISVAEFTAALAEHVPMEYATFLGELFAFLLDGHNAHLTHDVERVLGRKPRDFREFARNAARSGAWAQ